MATRGGGPTASGTDGNDYSHRETIVAQYYIRPPPKSQPKGMGYSDDINNDPGVYEPEDQHMHKSPLSYPDTKDFIAQFMKTPEQHNPTYPLPPQQQYPSQPCIESPPSVSLNTGSCYSNVPNPINVPNGMVMVPANQMMMLAPQWMFGQQGTQIPQHINVSTAPNSRPVTPIPSPEPPPIPQPTFKDTNLPSDYKGLGGPDSVPFRMPKNEVAPRSAISPKKSLIDELYLAPTSDVRQRSNRTIMNTEIAQTKSRLKWSVLFHYVLGFILFAKLVPDILDRLGIFVLEIEELLIPKAKLWELFWILSIPATLLGLLSSKKSNASMMTKFFYSILVLGLFPVLVGFAANFSELYRYASSKDIEKVETWNGFPVSVLWYVYLFMALQAHLFELYFAKTLIKVWQPRKKKTQ
uniref:Jagunal n=1 Tax=Lepeophtheirus salmonis TaxID=72036 RepID=A0A0K2SZT6_LEPSM